MTDKSFFKLDDDGIYYWVVSSSLEHAKQLMRESQCVFGPAECAFDVAAGLVWTALSPEQVAQKQRCHTDDDRGVIKRADANIGDWFSSEW
jgi:hypothetical protein